MRIGIIDMNNLFARAWFVVQRSNPSVVPTDLASQCSRMLKKINRDFLIECFFVCWDGDKDAERLALHPEYKSGRQKSHGYYENLEKTRKILSNSDKLINMYYKNREADDIIATLARNYDSPLHDVFIFSNDKDMFQLITKNVTVIRSQKDASKNLLDATTFKKQFGFPPERFVDYYAMRGDVSDNIPGATGIGEKIAQKLIINYESLGGIYNNIDKIKKDTKKKLLAQKKSVMLSKKLITLKTIDLGVDWIVF